MGWESDKTYYLNTNHLLGLRNRFVTWQADNNSVFWSAKEAYFEFKTQSNILFHK